MGVLMWDKPKPIRTPAETKGISWEDGPAGGLLPNMSDADAFAWKAKVTGMKLGFPQVEIRKTLKTNRGDRVQLTIIVNLGKGYNYKQYRTDDKDFKPAKNVNVHIAMNGPAQLSFKDFDTMNEAVAEAKAHLETLA